MNYQPGLHILSSFRARTALLADAAFCEELFEGLIAALGLTKVGATYHSFPGGGFTAVVCLTESHLSIHTWPEYGHATFDVFLSNHTRNNTDKVSAIHTAVIEAFEADEISKHEIIR